MRLRSLDADDARAYLEELRLRLLFVRIQAGRVNLRWWVPTWAIEEPIRFLLRLLPLLRALAPAASRRVLARISLPVGGEDLPTSASLWTTFDALFSEHDRDLLALPHDVPFVDVQTDDVRVYIGQTRI